MINSFTKNSVNQIPALFKKINWEWGQKNLDIGGGKYDTTTNYLIQIGIGVENFVYDPYNRTTEHNEKVLLHPRYNSATIANVLNVIPTRSERVRALMTAHKHVRCNGKIYISVYEGDKSGNGSISISGTYQANKKLREYLEDISEVWPKEFVKIKRNMIEVTNGNNKTLRQLRSASM